MEICKTFSKSIAGNQMQKYSTCIILNVSFVFNSSSIAVSTFSSHCLRNWDVYWDTNWKYFSTRHMTDRCISTANIIRTNQRFSQKNLQQRYPSDIFQGNNAHQMICGFLTEVINTTHTRLVIFDNICTWDRYFGAGILGQVFWRSVLLLYV